MSAPADEEYLRVVDEYKNFDIDGFKREVMDDFEKEVSGFVSSEDTNKGEGVKKIQQYERLHADHQNLQKENIAAGTERKEILETIQGDTNEYADFAKAATHEKRSLRDNLADLGDTLRKLRYQLSNVTLENKSLQLVVDTEASLRDAKAKSEITAVTTVNVDLKDQVNRVEKNLSEEGEKKGEANRVLKDLTSKHNNAKDNFDNLLNTSESEKKRVNGELESLKGKLSEQINQNLSLNKDVSGNEQNINRLTADIAQLNNDLNQLKMKNQNDIT